MDDTQPDTEETPTNTHNIGNVSNNELAADVREAIAASDGPSRVELKSGYIEPADEDVLWIRQHAGTETFETATIYKLRRETTRAAGGALIPLYRGVFEPYEDGAGDLHPAITASVGPTTASGTIDGADFDAGRVQLVASDPDPDLGGFDVAVAPSDPAGWTDEALKDAGGDRW